MRDFNEELYSNKSNMIIQNYAWALKEKQLKIMELLCSCYMTNYYDAEKNTITVGLADFMRELGYTATNQGGWAYNDFKKVIKDLSDKSIIGMGFNGNERLIRLINTFEHLQGTNQIRCFMSEDFKECMKLHDRGNTKVEFKTICSMNSRFSIKLYNLLRSWQGKDEVYFDLDYLKELLNVTAKSYSNYAKFRQTVLDVAVDEINEKTELHISYKGLVGRRGSKVTRVVFSIKNKNSLVSSSAGSDKPDANTANRADIPSDFELYLKEALPVEVHNDEISRVRAINDVAQKYIHVNFSQFLADALEDSDSEKTELEKVSEATRMSNEDRNDRVLKAVRTFTIREYNVRKENIKTSPFAYFIAGFDKWLSNNPNQ